jgi:hypothetical protein
MKKTLTALFAAATIAVSLAATATDTSAQYYGHRHHHHGGVAAGVAAGLIGGLIVGGAIANAQPAPVYVAPAPATCIVDQQVWSNRYQAWVVRPVRVPC